MKKFGKILLIIVVIGGVLYGSYMFFLMPKGFVSETEVTQSFLDNIKTTTVCEEHFNPETISLCETFTTGLADSEIIVVSIVKLGDTMHVTLSVGDTSESFVFSFLEIDNSGVNGFLNKTYYKIDLIE